MPLLLNVFSWKLYLNCVLFVKTLSILKELHMLDREYTLFFTRTPKLHYLALVSLTIKYFSVCFTVSASVHPINSYNIQT